MLSSQVFNLKVPSVLHLFLLLCLIGISSGKTTTLKELKPVLIKSVVPHPHNPVYNDGQQIQPQGTSQEEGGREEQRSSRKIYHIPAPGFHDNMRGGPSSQQDRDPERGQILHRPKSGGGRGSGGSSSQSNELPNDAPILLNGKGKKIQYVPTRGFQGPEKPPQVYVISSAGGGDDEDGSQGGVMGSMQTYFKSMTGRIRAAFQGLIGGITD